jgi:hypothetical protein
MTSLTGDECKAGSWCIFSLSNDVHNPINVSGRIKQILVKAGDHSGAGIVVFERFDILTALHPIYCMPVLQPAGGATSGVGEIIVVNTTEVKLLFNVQHDCFASGCDTSRRIAQLQERQESGQFSEVVCHRDNPVFIINTHAFHNAILLRKFIPRHLTEPHHIYPTRHQRHQDLAKELVAERKKKKEATKAKAQATRARKAAEKAEAAARAEALSLAQQEHILDHNLDVPSEDDESDGWDGGRRKRAREE